MLDLGAHQLPKYIQLPFESRDAILQRISLGFRLFESCLQTIDLVDTALAVASRSESVESAFLDTGGFFG